MRTTLLVVALVLTAGLAACSHGRTHGGTGGGDGGTHGGDGGTQNGDGGTSTGLCSGDLRSVVDSSGNIVTTCPPDQGCAGGACVPACDAAAASKGSLGCDYVLPTPSFYQSDRPPCWAVFVANSWPAPIELTVTRAGMSYDATQFGRIASTQPVTSWAPIPPTGLPQGAVGVLFTSHDPSSSNLTPLTCPVAPAISKDYGTALTGSGDSSEVTGRGQAFHIVASAPVTVYDILPFGGSSSYLPSASLLFPTTSWGTNYLGVVAKRSEMDDPQWGQIVASQDGTVVTLLPSVDLPAGASVTAAPKGQPATFDLAAGEYIQWQDSAEMSGTIISSNKPVGFVGGTTYDCYSSSSNGIGGCDSAHQMMPPISAYGSTYAIAPFATRAQSMADESIPYRIVGSVDGTTLVFDPPSAGAPTTLGKGQIADFEATGAFTVSAQDNAHPFYVAQVMTGCENGSRAGCGDTSISGGSCCLGDEEYVNLLPPAQFLTSYVFFTDPTYATTNLVFTRVRNSGAFADVTLDCLGAPVSGWKDLGTSGTYQYANVDLLRAGMKNGGCDNGPHTASSAAPFGVTVWGLDTFASYAYPAGGNVGAINSVVVPPICTEQSYKSWA